MFYKRRDYSQVVNGRNPIVAHEYLGDCVEGKDVFIADDIISSGECMLDIAYALKKQRRKAAFLPTPPTPFSQTAWMPSTKPMRDGMICGRVRLPTFTYRTPELLSRAWFHEVDCIQVHRLFHRRAEPRHFRQRHHRSPRKDQGSARTHRTGPLSIFLRFYRKARCFYSGPLVFRRFSALDQRSVVKSGLWGYNQDKIKTARQSRRAGRNRMDARYTGEQIAAARRAKGLTQKQLADALGVTDKAVSKWERGLNYPDIVLFQPISELLGLPLLQLFCKDGLSAEQAVAAAAALSAQEKQAVRRDMKWHAVFRLAAALTLSAALVYVSRVLDLHGIYGWPQGCTMGMLPFTGWLAGDAVFTLRQVKKL